MTTRYSNKKFWMVFDPGYRDSMPRVQFEDENEAIECAKDVQQKNGSPRVWLLEATKSIVPAAEPQRVEVLA